MFNFTIKWLRWRKNLPFTHKKNVIQVLEYHYQCFTNILNKKSLNKLIKCLIFNMIK